jgi:hypothetical protein
MEDAKKKEKKQSEKTEEKEIKPTGKDKDKKEEQELVICATFLNTLNKGSRAAFLPESLTAWLTWLNRPKALSFKIITNCLSLL